MQLRNNIGDSIMLIEVPQYIIFIDHYFTDGSQLHYNKFRLIQRIVESKYPFRLKPNHLFQYTTNFKDLINNMAGSTKIHNFRNMLYSIKIY